MDQENGVSVDQTNENPSVIINISVQESTVITNSDDHDHQVDYSHGTKGSGVDDHVKETEKETCGSSIVDYSTKGSDLDEPVKEKENERCGSCVLDGGDENGEKQGDIGNQRLCRICHLSSLESGKSYVDLIVLGCGCKGDIACAHPHCAEAWFKHKGNRICEICGEIANNVTGAFDVKFMKEWNENRSTVGDIDSSERRRGCWQGQPLCNFLMACLVIAFVLPWFFRVNMF